MVYSFNSSAFPSKCFWQMYLRSLSRVGARLKMPEERRDSTAAFSASAD